ncbi:MAG: hypothetical protein FJW27_16130 [Acidimicrobiia bacterium]|nr:hypothetical protein [Acidimicrobiia bacterium]
MSPTPTVPRRGPVARLALAIGVAASGLCLHVATGHAQSSDGTRPGERPVTIPYLARAGSDIEFAAAECDIAPHGEQMMCRFRQVFITVASTDATACVITTNGYHQTFRRASSTKWVSTEGPDGLCGRLEPTTLDDGGGTRWMMTIERRGADGGDRAECGAPVEPPVVFGWRDIKRALPCATIQPGAIER